MVVPYLPVLARCGHRVWQATLADWWRRWSWRAPVPSPAAALTAASRVAQWPIATLDEIAAWLGRDGPRTPRAGGRRAVVAPLALGGRGARRPGLPGRVGQGSAHRSAGSARLWQPVVPWAAPDRTYALARRALDPGPPGWRCGRWVVDEPAAGPPCHKRDLAGTLRAARASSVGRLPFDFVRFLVRLDLAQRRQRSRLGWVALRDPLRRRRLHRAPSDACAAVGTPVPCGAWSRIGPLYRFVDLDP